MTAWYERSCRSGCYKESRLNFLGSRQSLVFGCLCRVQSCGQATQAHFSDDRQGWRGRNHLQDCCAFVWCIRLPTDPGLSMCFFYQDIEYQSA